MSNTQTNSTPKRPPPKPLPIWTAWPDVTDEGTPMARVRLECGQYSFTAGSQYDPSKVGDFAKRVRNVINAITHHANSEGWLK